MNKTLKLVGILALLSGITLLLLFWNGDNQQEFPEIHLTSGTEVESIVITNSETIELAQKSAQWMVNGLYPMDDNLSAILTALFEKIRIKRFVEGSERKEIENLISTNATKILLSFGGGQTSTWVMIGQPEVQKTFLMIDENLFEVNLPGYNSYIAGLFEMPASDWRSRRIFDGTIQSLYKMKMVNPSDSFSIQFQTPFYQVEGIPDFDTLAFINQLEASANWRVNRWEANPETAHLQKILTLEMEDINPTLNTELVFYQAPQTDQFWINRNKNDWATITPSQFDFWASWKRSVQNWKQ